MDFTLPSPSSDVTFIIEGKKVYANKAVLCMCSRVFRTMFQSDVKQRDMREVRELPDKRFKDFLTLMALVHPLPSIYVDDTNVEVVLPLAREYRIREVVKQCEQVLMNQPLCARNLGLAIKFSLHELRKSFFHYLNRGLYPMLAKDPEFKRLDEEIRVEIRERLAMVEKPSIKNFILAGKYDETEVKEKCLQYMRDTPLSQLEVENGFDKLEPSVLTELLTHKVKKLEQARDKDKVLVDINVAHLSDKVKLEKRLQWLTTEIGHLANWGRMRRNEWCGSGRHSKGDSYHCTGCFKDRLAAIRKILARYRIEEEKTENLYERF